MKKGYTRAWRKELESDIWKMPPLYHRVFYYLRLKAQWKTDLFPTRKLGIWLSPGMYITSILDIANGVSYIEYGVKRVPNKKSIFKILKWLESNGMICLESNARGTTIYITNWDTYQAEDIEKITDKTGEFGNAPRTTPRTTPRTHLKNNKEYITLKEKEIKNIYGEFRHVRLTASEYKKLTEKLTEEKTKEWITTLDEGIELKGYKYQSHYQAILNWIKRDNSANGLFTITEQEVQEMTEKIAAKKLAAKKLATLPTPRKGGLPGKIYSRNDLNNESIEMLRKYSGGKTNVIT